MMIMSSSNTTVEMDTMQQRRRMQLDRIDKIITKQGIPTYVAAWLRNPARKAMRAALLEDASSMTPYVQLYHHHSMLFRPAGHPGDPGSFRYRPLPDLRFDASRRIGTAVLKTCVFSDHADEAAQYPRIVDRIHGALDAWHAAGMTGLVLDFRKHSGGNMWPLMAAFERYLLDVPLFAWRSTAASPRDRVWMTMVRRDQEDPSNVNRFFQTYETVDTEAARRPPLRDRRIRVAVLLGPKTYSSGELVAAAFCGKQRVRSFGSVTGGGLSVNEGFPVDRTLTLNLTVQLVCTVAGRLIEHIVPDVACDDPEEKAVQWLRSRKT
jgi:hypothetical protein